MRGWIAAIAMALIASCGDGGIGSETGEVEAALTSDFTPPTGRAAGPAEFGPWSSRLMTAVSSDGIIWTRTDLVVTDQGDVPDLAVDADGRVYLYYTGWTVGDETNVLAVAISDDGGGTWVYKKVVLSGFDGMSQPVDPDVQILDDGAFRLYLTSEAFDGQGPHTWYAEGADGIHFEKKGSAFVTTGKQVLDPSTFRAGSTWHIFAGGDTPTSKGNWHGTSTDGTSFTVAGEVILTKENIQYMAANCIPVAGGYRLYAFGEEPGGANRIASFFSSDGWQWAAEEGFRLELDLSTGLESDGVKDPAVAKLVDGTYLMVYSTTIP